MAELSILNPTMADVAKALDPDGSVAMTVELLHQQNDILDHATWIECNDGTSHQSSVRTGLPLPTWRQIYGTVNPTKSERAQVVDSTGMLEAYAEIDKKLADLNGNGPAFRLSEDMAHIEGINQEFASTLIYGNDGTASEEFTGIAARFNSLSAENAVNIIDAGGDDTDLTSIYLVVWAPTTAFCIYPKGIPTGIQVTDKGQTTKESAAGLMEVYRTHYSFDCGFVVRDWRYIVRIANIDLSTIVKDFATGPDLLDLMTQAVELVPNINAGRAAFYCSRSVRSWLRRQARKQVANSTLSMESIAGKKFVVFDDVPVGRVDAILHTEDRVV